MREQQLGPYLLKQVVGRGGMGTVYRAEHKETGEICAVKALAPTYAHDDHFRARFESEIKALLKLDHPNIVRLISYGQNEGNLFFAMELVDGKSLFQLQREGYRFDWREILKIGKDIALGLRHAHDRGVIHRDLKPGNLLRSSKGENKITDFGIAKNFGSSQNTGENVLGTMDFMSPEQAKGQPVTFKSDLYSLGTVMFTLLSGKPPFKANSVEESLRNLTKVPPPRVSSIAPDVPDEIDQLIRQLMDKDPSKRVQTAQALLHRIEEIEQTLKFYSEAQTAHNPKSSNDTFVMQQPESVPTTEKHPRKPSTSQPKTIRHTTVDTGSGERKAEELAKQDYFNTVTEQQRLREQVESKSDGFSRGTLPLILGLAAVLLLGGIGMFQALRTPAADDLYEQITLSEKSPDRVREQIAQFIAAYPDDERFAEVKRLDGIAAAIALHKRLSIRSGVPSSTLTLIQREFLEAVNTAKFDPPASFSKLSAFLTLHRDEAELSGEDEACLTAAKSYIIKIEDEARTEIKANRGKIQQVLQRASNESPGDAIKTYESILELYGELEYAKDLVDETREKLKKLSKE